MINLRYHIVSIVAVFLALGIGLALGSTFVDSVLVSNLESQVDQFQEDRDAAVSRTAELEQLLEQRDAESAEFESAAVPLLGTGRLDGVPLLVVVTEGVPGEWVADLRNMILAGNADYRGVIEITRRLDIASDEIRAEIQELFELAGDGPGVVTRAVSFLVAQELYAPDEATIGGSIRTALTMLRDAGFMTWDPTSATVRDLRAVPADGLRLLLVSEPDAVVNADLFVPLLRELDTSGYLPGAVAAQHGSEGGLASLVRADDGLVADVVTVDGVDTFAGVFALSVALEQLPSVGHYGVGDDALAVLPTP